MHVKHRNESRVPIEVLRQRVRYDPVTGELRWADRVPEHLFANAHGCAVWHAKFAGKVVGKRTRGYVVVAVTAGGKTQYLQGHRVAWALMTGAWPEHEIDHEDRNHGNNKWSNLRPATHQTNQWNKGPGVRNRSGHVGVHQHQGRWRAQIRVGGRTQSLGMFDTPELASAARQRAAEAAHGQFAPH